MRRLTILSCLFLIGLAVIIFVINTPNKILLFDAKAIQTSKNNLMFMVTLRMENSGGPDRLISVYSPLAKSAYIMNSIAGSSVIVIPQNGTGILAMDGAHVMLMAMSDSLEKGALIPITLKFENAGSVSTNAKISEKSIMNHSRSNGIHGNPAPTVAVSWKKSPSATGATLQLSVDNFTFVPLRDDLKHIPNQGHAHIYLNGLKLGRLYAETYEVGSLLPGKYRLSVVLNSNDHRPYLTNGQLVASFLEFEIPQV